MPHSERCTWGGSQLVDHLVDCLGIYDRSKGWPARGGSGGSGKQSAEGDALRRWLCRLTPEKRLEVRSPPSASSPRPAAQLEASVPRRHRGRR